MNTELKTREEIIDELSAIESRLEELSEDIDSFTDTYANQARRLITQALSATEEAKTWLNHENQ